MTLSVGLGHHGQLLAWATLCQLESKTVNALDTGTGKYRYLGSHFFWQAAVHAATITGVLTL
ncbi:hypothetical protein D3C81_2181670 [compost metagenome]